MLKLAVFVSPQAYRVVLYVRPLNPREKRLPRDVMENALNVARQRKMTYCTVRSTNSEVIKQKEDYGSLASEIRELKEMVKMLMENAAKKA